MRISMSEWYSAGNNVVQMQRFWNRLSDINVQGIEERAKANVARIGNVNMDQYARNRATIEAVNYVQNTRQKELGAILDYFA